MIQLPTNISDLAQWLLIPGVLGAIATALVNLYQPTWKWAKTIRFLLRAITYGAVGLISFYLTTVPSAVLQQYQPAFLIFAAVFAAWAGDTMIQAGKTAVVGMWRGIRFAGVRLLLGRDNFRADFGHLLTGGMH